MSWLIVQLTEEGEAASYESVEAEIIRLIGKCAVFFPYPSHPKESLSDISEYPYRGYVFLKLQNPTKSYSLKRSFLFEGPLMYSFDGRNRVLVFISEEEMMSIRSELKRAYSFIPKLGSMVRFKTGEFKGLLAMVTQRISDDKVLVESNLNSIKVCREMNVSSLVQESHMKTNVVIDGMNLAYRTAWSLRFLANSKGVKTGMIFGFIRSLSYLRKKYNFDTFYVVWDRTPVEKLEKLDSYKANRPDNSSLNIFPQMKLLEDILANLGVFQVWADGHEADDVICSLIKKELSQDLNYIYSADDDFLQLVKDGKIIVIKPPLGRGEEDEAFDEEAVKKRFGVPPNKLPLYRSVKGDKSDNLPGVPRINAERLASVVAKFEAIDDFVLAIDKGSVDFAYFSQSEKLRVLDSKDLISLNYQLMKLRDDVDFEVRWGSFNGENLKNIFIDLEFSSYLQKMSELEKDFRGPNAFFKVS